MSHHPYSVQGSGACVLVWVPCGFGGVGVVWVCIRPMAAATPYAPALASDSTSLTLLSV